MLSLEENKSFKLWLAKNTSYQVRSIKDSVSRLNRVATMVDVNQRIKTDEIIFRLSRKDQFSDLSMSVKSQLKKALILYREYKGL